MNWIPIILLVLGGIILTIGDITMKEWVASNNNYFYAIGLIIYMVGMNFLVQSFRYKNIAVASVLFVMFNVVSLIIVSWILFKEKVTGIQLIGILLGLISVSILEFSDK